MGNRETDKNIDISCYNEKIHECIDKIIKLCGDNKVLDNVVELSEEDEKKFSEHVDKLIVILCDLVKAQREKPEYDAFILQLPDGKFWEKVQNEVERRTKKFLTAISFNSLEENDRHELLRQGFDDIFYERESYEYITNKVKNNDIARTLWGVLMESEYAIVTAYVSKRRFMLGVADSYGLINDDLQYIWTMFEDNYEAVERHEFHRRNMYLVKMIEKISGDVDELKERTESIEELILMNARKLNKNYH